MQELILILYQQIRQVSHLSVSIYFYWICKLILSILIIENYILEYEAVEKYYDMKKKIEKYYETNKKFKPKQKKASLMEAPSLRTLREHTDC